MRIDFAPLTRSTVGFDRLFSILEGAQRQAQADAGYPPYNIERVSEDGYRITIAVAGFSESELSLVQQENLLIVTGKQKAEEGVVFLHRGIAARAFERRFNLADYVRVSAASLENGLLVIDLVREVPESVKPRAIQIQRADAVSTSAPVAQSPAATIEQQAA
jgi:molecular chaperone IbpA